MTEPSFGEIFNLTAIDPNSQVSLSGCPASVGSLEQTVANYEHNVSPVINIPIASFSDDYGNREFVAMTNDVDSYHFKVYQVDTSTPAINLLSSTAYYASMPFRVVWWMGIKKVSSSLYYVYYASSDQTSFVAPTYVRFGKLAVVPGVSVTDTLINTVTLATGSNIRWDILVNSSLIVGRTANLPLQKANWSGTATLDFYIYSLDMDTETFSGGSVLHVAEDDSGYHGGGIALYESMGTLHWCAAYITTVDYYLCSCVSIDGTQVIVKAGLNWDSPVDWIVEIGADQYNTRDSLAKGVFRRTAHPADNHYVNIPNGVVGTAISGFIPSAPASVTFNSPTVFPAIGYNSGYYFVDPTTGLATTPVTVSGVSQIYDIFPTLDGINFGIYMNVKMADNSQKIIGVDPNYWTINNTIDVALPSTTNAPNDFNHGNFFIQWSATSLYVTYLLNLIARNVNVVMGILELN